MYDNGLLRCEIAVASIGCAGALGPPPVFRGNYPPMTPRCADGVEALRQMGKRNVGITNGGHTRKRVDSFENLIYNVNKLKTLHSKR